MPGFNQTLRSLQPILRILILVGLLTGCSTLGVRVDSRPEVTQFRQTRQLLASATNLLPAREWLRRAQARHRSSAERLTDLLNCAQAALPLALEGDDEGTKIYNAAVAQIVTRLQADQFASQTTGAWRVEVTRTGKEVLDPNLPESIIPAASVRITGLLQRTVQSGIGVPYVFCYAKDSSFLAGQPGISQAGISTPATATLTFSGSQARLIFQDTLRSDHQKIDGQRVQLAADFSAPLALVVSRSENRSIDIRSFLLTRQRLAGAGLFQYQPYDPNKIPVVFVHGLLSRPEAWTQAVNGLMADPEIRKRYQFWFMLYPTGLPVWQSAALLRSELDRFHRELERNGRNPQLHRIVLIGHSMGGIISSLVVRQGGDKLWKQFSDTRLDQLNLSPEARKKIEEAIYFPPRRDVSRVIFVATPHRGSRLAVNPIANLLARLIRLPNFLQLNDRNELVNSIREDARNLFAAPGNSILFLRANSPLLKSIQMLPLSNKIPYHSIIGDRGRGNTPNSSDGIVPYWSSHLESAKSEKIVPSGHGANENAEAIEEMRRILVEAL